MRKIRFPIVAVRGNRWLSTLVIGLVVSMLAAIVAMRDPVGHSAAASEDESIASVAILVPDDRLDPRIVALQLRGGGWTRAVERLDEALFDVASNERRLGNAVERLEKLRDEIADVVAAHAAVTIEVQGLGEQLAEVEAVLRIRALDRFVHFGDEPLLGLDDPAVATDAARSAAIGRRVDEVQFSTREEILVRQRATTTEERTLVGRAVELTASIASTESVVERHAGDTDLLAAAVDAAIDRVRTTRWSASIPGVDLSVVALDAYLNAEELLAENRPSCAARWWMVAGIARIESRHGRFGGRTLRADGRVDRPIIGIALDGGPGVRAMVDTDGGEFDGDEVWDRAVGPLQFIPETWRIRGRDGSGDGYADPQNIYDAAYSAGRYLCALGGDLSSRAALRGAYFGYNNSSVYVADVIGYADRYAALELPIAAETTSAVVEAVENQN